MSQARSIRRAAERSARKLARKQEKNFRQLGLPASLHRDEGSHVAAAPASDTLATPSPVASPAKLAANRANAQLSTGPKTAAGKAASCQNNFKHGLYSKLLVLPSEDAAELDALKLDLLVEHQPANTTESILVNEMAENFWRLKRARRFETFFLASSAPVSQVNLSSRMMASAERGFHKALKTLRELQKQRGFVPQNTSAVSHTDSAAGLAPESNPGFEPQEEPKKVETPPVRMPTEAEKRAQYAWIIADPKTSPEKRAMFEELLRARLEDDQLKAELATIGMAA